MTGTLKKGLAILMALFLGMQIWPVTVEASAVNLPEGMLSDQGDGIVWLDASVTNPDDYLNIVGFEITFKLLEEGVYGGGAKVNLLFFATGENTIDDLEMTYDEGTGFPSFVHNVDEIVTVGSGEASFLAGMFFSNGMDIGALSVGESKTITYEGTKALFSEDCSVITAFSYTGGFEIESIDWIVGVPEGREDQVTLDWEPVETVEYKDVQTVEGGSEANYVDITVPAQGEGPFPVIFWIHGGGWAAYDRTSCIVSDTRDFLLSQGYAFVSAEYTLCKRGEDGNSVVESGYPQMIYDLKAAVRFLRAHAEEYKLDTRFIAAMGESAGGHLAMLLGTTNGSEAHEDFSMGNEAYSSDVQAMVSYFGPSVFTGEEQEIFAYAMLGDLATEGGEEAELLKEQMSPYHQITSEAPALFMVHGMNDETVPVVHSQMMEEMASVLLDEGDLVAIYLENGPHGNKAFFDQEYIMSRLQSFLTKQSAKYLTQESGTKPDSRESSEEEVSDSSDHEKTADSASDNSDEVPENSMVQEDSGGINIIVAVVVAVVVLTAAAMGIVAVGKRKTRHK